MDSSDAVLPAAAEAVGFLAYFKDLADPRQQGKVIYPLEEQGHSILITLGSTICQDAVEVHGVAPKGIGDVVDLVEPQDVEGETAQDGEDGRALADAAGVLMHGNVEHIVDAVLHPPVASGRGGIIGGAVAVLG